jgi:DNA modification methylase
MTKKLDSVIKKQIKGKSAGRRKSLAHKTEVQASVAGGLPNDLVKALKVEVRAIAELKPAKRRIRRSTPKQVEALIQSIRKRGFRMPILVRGDVIVDGHTRVDAMKALNQTEIPTLNISDLSEDETRVLAISVNHIAEMGEWELPELRLEAVELTALGFDCQETGFSLPEWDAIKLDPDPSPDSVLNSVPAIDNGPPVSLLGDLWLLGPHKLLCGNALEGASYPTLLGSEKIDGAITDPPYNCPIPGNVSGLGKVKHNNFAEACGEKSDEEFEAFLAAPMSQARERSKEGAVFYVFMDHRQIHILYAAAEAAGLKRLNLAVWNKGSGGMGALYRSQHELCAVLCHGTKPATNNVELGKHGRDRSNVWSYPGANNPGSSAIKVLADHPTPKPVEMLVDALLDTTKEGEVILDPFLGSGSTLIACAEAHRVCRGIEIDPKYVDCTLRRWFELTDEQPTLAETGETFDEVAVRRAAEIDQ